MGESLGISREVKTLKPAKSEVVDKNVSLRITKLFKGKDISLAKGEDGKEKEAEGILGHSKIWRSEVDKRWRKQEMGNKILNLIVF